MAKQVKVQVTSQDLHDGVMESASNCPIALALRKIYPDAEYVRVNYRTAMVDTTVFTLSKAATRFIERFDKGSYAAKPATFILRNM